MQEKYRCIVFDMDGVLVDVYSSWSFVHDHFGVNNDDSLKMYLEGEIDDLEFIRRDIELWRGKKEDVSRKDIAEILEDVPVMDGLEDCLMELKDRGFFTMVISGGLKPLAEKIGCDYFDVISANDIEEHEGCLSGEGIVEVPLKDKGRAFDKLLAKTGCKADETVAVGNSFSDAPMLEKAGLGIAFNPSDEKVKEAADVVIEEKDLKRILEYF